jgi:hypothetical protein
MLLFHLVLRMEACQTVRSERTGVTWPIRTMLGCKLPVYRIASSLMTRGATTLRGENVVVHNRRAVKLQRVHAEGRWNFANALALNYPNTQYESLVDTSRRLAGRCERWLIGHTGRKMMSDHGVAPSRRGEMRYFPRFRSHENDPPGGVDDQDSFHPHGRKQLPRTHSSCYFE